MKIFRNISKSFWFQFVPAMLLGVLTIYFLAVGLIPLYYLIYTFVMWVLVCGLGVAVGYHRVFSHRTHSLPAWKENIIMFFAAFAGQGGSIFWVALHRGYHHPYSDTAQDIHSPNSHSMLEAFIGWQYRITETNNTVNLKYSVDLLRKKNHLWFHKHNLKILWGIPLVVALFNWQFALMAFCLVTFIASFQDNLVNVFGHKKGFIGYRNFDTKDKSQNNFLLGLFGWGQGWHNNHHYDPKSFNFGSGVSKRKWEIDPCVIFLPFLTRFN